MKGILQSILFLLIGSLIITSCSDEKRGESPERIELDSEEQVMDSIIGDSIVKDELIVNPPPAPPPVKPTPRPEPPAPWPIEPEPDPEPLIDPVEVQYVPIADFNDVEALYPGGTKAMMKFISDNVKYPIIDAEAGNQGRVYVQFVVEKDGSLNEVNIKRGVSKTIDQEAIRVFSLMPKWKPAESGGKTVRSRVVLPLNFTLE